MNIHSVTVQCYGITERREISLVPHVTAVAALLQLYDQNLAPGSLPALMTAGMLQFPRPPACRLPSMPFWLPAIHAICPLANLCGLASTDHTCPAWPFTKQLLAAWGFLFQVIHCSLLARPGKYGLVAATASWRARVELPHQRQQKETGKKSAEAVEWQGPRSTG